MTVLVGDGLRGNRTAHSVHPTSFWLGQGSLSNQPVAQTQALGCVLSCMRCETRFFALPVWVWSVHLPRR